MDDIVEKLEAFEEDATHGVPIGIHNISGIYRSYEERVLREDADPQEAVGAFLRSILGKTYLHPKEKNTLVDGDDHLRVDEKKHEAFFEWFEQEYRVEQQRDFTAIKDRLIEEDTRRRNGDFYTPAVWAAEAHEVLEQELGEDWREEYVVWDCACGTANLTRDRQFEELYLSTLYEDDVRTIEEMGYHTGEEGEVFQFDFLEDPLEVGMVEKAEGHTETIPGGLRRALEDGRKFVFLINPPFGTASASTKGGSNKEGVSFTAVKDQMDLGRAGNQLYAQFMWRITEIVRKYDLDDAALGLYSKPLFMSGSSFEKFRKYFYPQWSYQDGFLFPADEFNGTSYAWGCSFTLWRDGKEKNRSFGLTVKERGEMGIVKDQRKKVSTTLTNVLKSGQSLREIFGGGKKKMLRNYLVL